MNTKNSQSITIALAPKEQNGQQSLAATLEISVELLHKLEEIQHVQASYNDLALTLEDIIDECTEDMYTECRSDRNFYRDHLLNHNEVKSVLDVMAVVSWSSETSSIPYSIENLPCVAESYSSNVGVQLRQLDDTHLLAAVYINNEMIQLYTLPLSQARNAVHAYNIATDKWFEDFTVRPLLNELETAAVAVKLGTK